ncbi:MAG: hypothetical protein AB7D57_13620 [Desulfovibrionaceae bacterium]
MSEHNPSPEQVETWKREMYEKLSARQRKWVDRLGYENWDPFQKPMDPIDIRVETTGLTATQLAGLFLQERAGSIGSDYRENISRFTVELVMNFERVRPIYDFCTWYAERLARHGKTV